MKKTKKMAARTLSVICAASTAISVYGAQSKREAWNNAAGGKDTAVSLENGETVYPNVYSDESSWSEFKELWDEIRTNYYQIALTPGEDETMLNAAWYSAVRETPAVRIVDDDGNVIKTVNGSQDLENVSSVTENDVTTTLYPCKVTISGIEENTTYKYQYFVNGEWSDVYTYTSQSTDSYKVLYVGDPQIGASKGQETTEENTFANSTEYYARNDAYNWNQTLLNAYSRNPDLSFILSAGDQINQTSVSKDADILEQQVEYSGFLYSSVLRSLPLATTIGNHDSKSVNYKNHFNNPNSYTEEVGASTAGNDYYFSYGNTLYVVINTNNYNCQTHKDLIDEALASYPDATWKILMFHQDIYGSGYDHSDSDGMILRTQLTPIIDEAGFDVVLQGHDHTYSRTYQISSDGNSYTAYDSSNYRDNNEVYLADNANCYDILTGEESISKVIDPEGTVYFEANSASGSKYYQLIGTQQDYIAARNQSWRPTYSVIEVTDVTLTVRTYDAETGEELVADDGIATAYTIVKSADKTALEEKLTEAKELVSQTDKYTEDSISSLSAVILAAEDIYDNAESSTVDVASAVENLVAAISALEEKADEEPTTDETTADETTADETTADETTADASSETTDDANTASDTGNIPYAAAAAVAVISGLMLIVLLVEDKIFRNRETRI